MARKKECNPLKSFYMAIDDGTTETHEIGDAYGVDVMCEYFSID